MKREGLFEGGEGGIREETCVHFKKAEFVKNLLQVCLKSIKHEGQGAVNR